MQRTLNSDRLRGFTLVELMITVGIVAILAAIAIPSYQSFVRQSNRTDATRTMALDAQALQRCYSQNFSYLAAGCNIVAGTVNSPNNYYSINIAIPSATQYTLTATPQGGQVGDTQCATIVLQSTGQQTAQDTSMNDTSKACWGTN
jgi:type IV pilus assembly protein PilE